MKYNGAWWKGIIIPLLIGISFNGFVLWPKLVQQLYIDKLKVVNKWDFSAQQRCIQTEDFAKDQRIVQRMDPKDVPICYEFALLFHKQKEEK